MMLPDHGSISSVDVYRAEGVLAERLGLDVAAARQVLQDEAAIRTMTMLEVAREVLAGEWSCPTAVLDPWGSC